MKEDSSVFCDAQASLFRHLPSISPSASRRHKSMDGTVGTTWCTQLACRLLEMLCKTMVDPLRQGTQDNCIPVGWDRISCVWSIGASVAIFAAAHPFIVHSDGDFYFSRSLPPLLRTHLLHTKHGVIRLDGMGRGFQLVVSPQERRRLLAQA